MYMCELASGDYDLSVGSGGPIVVGLVTVLDGLIGRVARGDGGDEEYQHACEFLSPERERRVREPLVRHRATAQPMMSPSLIPRQIKRRELSRH